MSDRFCPQCGAPHRPEARFCPGCGARLAQITTDFSADEQSPKGRGRRWVLGIGAVVIVLVVAVAAAVLVWKHGDDSPPVAVEVGAVSLHLKERVSVEGYLQIRKRGLTTVDGHFLERLVSTIDGRDEEVVLAIAETGSFQSQANCGHAVITDFMTSEVGTVIWDRYLNELHDEDRVRVTGKARAMEDVVRAQDLAGSEYEGTIVILAETLESLE